jgi:hypothetical protein
VNAAREAAAGTGPVVLAYQEGRAPRIAWVRAQAHRRDSTRGLTPAVRDKLLRLAGRRWHWPAAESCSPCRDGRAGSRARVNTEGCASVDLRLLYVGQHPYF